MLLRMDKMESKIIAEGKSDVPQAIAKGTAVPHPEYAMTDLSIFTLALQSPDIGDDFVKGIRKYLQNDRLNPEDLEEGLFEAETIQRERLERLFGAATNIWGGEETELSLLDDREVRKKLLTQSMALWGAVGGVTFGPIGMLIAGIVAGVFVRAQIDKIDKSRAIQECIDRISVIRSLIQE